MCVSGIIHLSATLSPPRTRCKGRWLKASTKNAHHHPPVVHLIHDHPTQAQESTEETVWLFIGYLLLVGGIPTPLKNMSSSVGMIIFNIWRKKNMFQTTNQIGNLLAIDIGFAFLPYVYILVP